MKLEVIKPVYILDGEEPYYIDYIIDLFDKNILQDHEKDFNYKVFYGSETSSDEVINECNSFPVFSSKRLVILKEAAQLKDFDRLESYLKNVNDTTILLIAYKHKKLDGRSTLTKFIKSKEGSNKIQYATFEKIKDYQIADWILNYVKGNNIKINVMNAELLAAQLGTNLQKIVNEIDKIKINLKEGDELSEDLIEKYIGISKDYNIFQFAKAVLERNSVMTFKIANYFIANSKDAPMVVITAMLYNEFNKLYKYHYSKNLPQAEMAKAIGVSPYFLKDYQRAGQAYDLAQTMKVIHIIYYYNLKAVGINIANNNMNMLKEFSYKILTVE
ncbi:MAG TPA: DNA polymerase III subunit delta [Chitinophagaceae bacterium]|nr:DNA polymerase III subunit delta [Chitinophagaceae bacterium]